MFDKEYFVSLFVDDELIYELFVDVEVNYHLLDEDKALNAAVQKICGDEIVNFTMGLVQNIDGVGMVGQYSYDKLSCRWSFRHRLFGDEYMKLVS